jgi:hypothetical protein
LWNLGDAKKGPLISDPKNVWVFGNFGSRDDAEIAQGKTLINPRMADQGWKVAPKLRQTQSGRTFRS